MKFVPCSLDEFDAVERMVDDGSYAFDVVEHQTFSAANDRAWVRTIDPDDQF